MAAWRARQHLSLGACHISRPAGQLQVQGVDRRVAAARQAGGARRDRSASCLLVCCRCDQPHRPRAHAPLLRARRRRGERRARGAERLGARVVLVGNGEAPITQECIEGYGAMGALATEDDRRGARVEGYHVGEHLETPY